MGKLSNLEGNIYGTWKVTSFAEIRNQHTYWNVECCHCGEKRVIEGCHLKNSSAKTCICSEQKETRKCPICQNDYNVPVKSTRKFCYECSPYYEHSSGRALTITAIRKAVKRNLVKHKGGKCQLCKYDRCIEALQFHHINPDEKDFQISDLTKYTPEAIQECFDEIEKCVLVCSNCHAEIHSGLRSL